MLSGRPERKPIPLHGGSPRLGSQQELDLGGGKLPPEPSGFRQKREQTIQVGDGRGHQLLWSFQVLGLLQRGLGLGGLWEGPEGGNHRQLLWRWELPWEVVRIASVLDVLLQLSESLKLEGLQKAVLAHSFGFRPSLGETAIEGGAGEAGVLLDLGHRMAVDGESVGHRRRWWEVGRRLKTSRGNPR
jgi:hypothetical protein